MTMHTDVAVIGSGVSAVALSLNLVELLPPTARVSLVGAENKRGRGVAYSTAEDCYLLNVPAERMSLFAERPDHFVQWLAENGHSSAGNDFVRRRVYGDYIADCLAAVLMRTGNRAALTLVDADACSVEAVQDGRLLFGLSDGSRLSATVSALCTGAGSRRLPLSEKMAPPEADPFLVQNPWADAWWERLPPKADVLFVGTGLTMVDQCLLLKRRGFQGTIHAVSRHGLLPQAHRLRRAGPLSSALVAGQGEVSEMLSTLRREADAADDWRAVMDGLRPVTQALWKGWTFDQRSRFLRHAASFWNAHRHRMAPAVAAEIEALCQSGQLMLHRGRLEGLQPAEGRITAEVRNRESLTVRADLVVNCTGFDRCMIDSSPFLTSLAEHGLVQPGPHGLGIDVDESSAARLATGEGNARLYALGALTAGRHWEITAVPDIRLQARSVAERIAARVQQDEQLVCA